MLLYVDFAICNHYGKNKTGTEAVFIKQRCWAEAEAAEAGKIIRKPPLPHVLSQSPNLERKFLLLFETPANNLFEENIVENSEVSRFF